MSCGVLRASTGGGSTKAAAKMLLLHRDSVLRTYRIALGREPLGHKLREGDGRTPEGCYVIDRRNPKSAYHLSLHISYPNMEDRERAQELGLDPGGDIMIHGVKRSPASGRRLDPRLHRRDGFGNGRNLGTRAGRNPHRDCGLKADSMPRMTRREFAAGLTAASLYAQELPANRLVLWYKRPAQKWTDALPVGNGRLGAMVFGGIAAERLQLNEDTLWSGAARASGTIPTRRSTSPRYARLVLKGRLRRGRRVCRQMQGPYNQSYQPLGDLRLTLDHSGEARGLPARTGSRYGRLARVVSHRRCGVCRARSSSPRRTRSSWCDSHDRAGRHELDRCDRQPRPVHVRSRRQCAAADRQGSRACRAELCAARTIRSSTIRPKAKACASRPASRRSPTAAGCARTATGCASKEPGPSHFLIAAKTGFLGYDRAPTGSAASIAESCRTQIAAAARKSYAALRGAHIADHQKLFRRVALELPKAGPVDLDTGERLAAFAAQPDPDLVALYFQYGRYLLIASSRPGSQPANLQGIWNETGAPSLVLQLDGQHQHPDELLAGGNLQPDGVPRAAVRPVQGLSKTGAKTAMVNYGCRGWVSHHNVDIWRQSAPVGDFGRRSPTWANWQMSGAVVLRASLGALRVHRRSRVSARHGPIPLMKSAAEFCLDWLIERKDGSSPPALPSPPRTISRHRMAAPRKPATAAPWTWRSSASCSPTASMPRKFSNTDAEFAARLRCGQSTTDPVPGGQTRPASGVVARFRREDARPAAHVSHVPAVSRQ